ncbi:MAG: YebC/PmpR family DNA-binding transcriptional regulator [Candidatus Jacksonbacteria bacterium]|nr:YebC/PmpR family DNA-binding transcriptional regulator [Candidatus Jacksonbacteria bacterium]
MSGHSKWTQIKHQKGADDKKRGKLFSILSKRISIAARADKNPKTNSALQTVIDKARAANMPGDTIDRAIKRGAGELPGHGALEEVVYEAYGPRGIQLVILTTTDNRNRTTSNIRHVVLQAGGSLSGSGSVLWNFTRDGELYAPKTDQSVDDETRRKIEELIADLKGDDDVDEVYTNLL